MKRSKPSGATGRKRKKEQEGTRAKYRDMSAASCLLTEDQFLCSICLDVFTDPVSTPCGHNFCKACISQHWDRNVLSQCPNCKEVFNIKPELRVNTFISETHLEPHLTRAGLKKHQLIDPEENLEGRMCVKHDKLLEQTLSKQMKKLLELKRVQQYEVEVTLDPDTAQPDLLLSDGRK
ncbi:tripartite motif-containing protein 65-like [Gymnodraco acuticeps]|uniref:Tripartite motif-containing protein 65-like n=1 Tax=Gymnodraco acuticeps TaxID=8218 RepID=A0A6P8U7A9_GYMAC|nr:tripartite motif-containing protein 65-like [Gymnodraco acuticeps]